MPVHKHKYQPLVKGPYGETEGILARGPLSRRDVTWLRKYNDQCVLTLTHVDADTLDFISDWSNLRSLRLYGCKIGDYSALTKLKRLENLFLNGARSRDTDWSFLSRLLRLKELGIGYVPHLTAFPDMSRCTRLRRLSIFNCKRLKDLSSILKIPSLESFHIVVTPQQPQDLEPIMAMPRMKFMTGAFGVRAKNVLFRELMAKHGLVYDG